MSELSDLQQYNHITHAVPPSGYEDLMILTPEILTESSEMFIQRFKRFELWFIYSIILIVGILFLVSSLIGINSNWYKNLNRSIANSYIVGVLLLASVAISFISVFMTWEHITPQSYSVDFSISIYLLIGDFLLLLWSAVFFQGNNILYSIYTSSILFLYHFWLFIYLWILKPVSAIFSIFLVIIYGYLFYTMIHIASVNSVPI